MSGHYILLKNPSMSPLRRVQGRLFEKGRKTTNSKLQTTNKLKTIITKSTLILLSSGSGQALKKEEIRQVEPDELMIDQTL
jgi:hypothetical protein